LVGWGRVVSVCEASGTWTVHLAASRKRNWIADTRAVIDAAGRNRLETSNTDQRSAGSRMKATTKAATNVRNMDRLSGEQWHN
jgi:hypothetical protein